MSSIVKTDEIDIKILRMLTNDARTTLEAMAKECAVSANAINKRVERLKAAGVITGTIIFINSESFGLQHSATVGINLDPNQEAEVAKLIRKFAYLVHLDRSFGKYDICAFVMAANMKQIEMLKETIRKHAGIRRIAVDFWGKIYFNYENIGLRQTKS